MKRVRRTLPVSPLKRLLKKRHFAVIAHKTDICSLINVCVYVIVNTFSSSVVEEIFGLSNGAEMLVANVTFNQTFPAK